MPRLWRSHDRHRGVRARLRAEVAADTGQDRYVMSQTFCRRCGFPVPMRWLHAGGDLSRTNYIHQPADRPLIRPDRNGYCTLPTSRACRHRGAVVLACRPSRSAPILILHSTPCTAGCHTSRDFVPWRFLDAGQLSLPSVSSLPASKNQNNNRHHWSIGHGQFTLRKTILFMSARTR
jgi:hypothetical protein